MGCQHSQSWSNQIRHESTYHPALIFLHQTFQNFQPHETKNQLVAYKEEEKEKKKPTSTTNPQALPHPIPFSKLINTTKSTIFSTDPTV